MENSFKKPKKMALGRGLDALIPNIEPVSEDTHKDYLLCDIDLINSNPYQPRIRFAEEELAELSASVKEQGIIQPLLVRKNAASGYYDLIAGERRLRAAKIAGLTQVPVVIRDVSDANMLEISLVENIQREDLNPLEESEAYYRLMTEFNMTQEQVADRVGKSRPAVANFLRLKNLPEQIKDSVREGQLSMGHARALLGLEKSAQQLDTWRMVIAKSLSVRQTEALVKHLKNEEKKPKKPVSDAAYFSNLSEELSRRFGTKVEIKRRGKKGKLEIEFYNDEDLDRVLTLLNIS
jgi:ParB family transcriptional regulator, chromosome partitioning protein